MEPYNMPTLSFGLIFYKTNSIKKLTLDENDFYEATTTKFKLNRNGSC